MSKQGRGSTQDKRDRARIRATKAACHICGEPIDYELGYLDPKSFVVDHIEALARGGADHISNKAAAHRDCNSIKRARPYAPIVRRSGSLK